MKLTISKTFIILLLSVLGVIALGTGVVLASDSAKPGDILYPLDIAIEELRLDLASTDEERLDLITSYYEERLDEVEDIQENAGEVTDLGSVKGLNVAIENISRYQARVGEIFSKLNQKFENGDLDQEKWERFEARFKELTERTEEKIERLRLLDAKIEERIDGKREDIVDMMIERGDSKVKLYERVRESTRGVK